MPSPAGTSSRPSQASLPDVSFHSLRHTSNSLLIAAGEDVLSISRRNGHATTRMTLDQYGHLFASSQKRTAETVDRIFADLENSRKIVVDPSRTKTKKKPAAPYGARVLIGGDEETRTPDPLHAKQKRGCGDLTNGPDMTRESHAFLALSLLADSADVRRFALAFGSVANLGQQKR